MISINLYQAGIIDERIDFAETWNELDLTELHAISRVMLSDLQEEVTQKSIILLELIKHRAAKKKIPVEVIQRIDPEDLTISGLPLVDFIYASNGLTRQPYTTIKVPADISFMNRRFGMIGPKDDFQNLTCGEYEAAEIIFLQFKESNDASLLASLAAVLYRKDAKEFISYNYRKSTYVTYDHEAYTKYFARLDHHVLFTIFLWYNGCRSMLPVFFPTLHEGSDAGTKDLMVFTKCIHAAAGPKNGTRDQVRRSGLLPLFFEMEQEAKKAKELQAEYDRRK
ncbi:MAG: hypothetical protein V4594_16725 [Bacteroidota bacterium]